MATGMMSNPWGYYLNEFGQTVPKTKEDYYFDHVLVKLALIEARLEKLEKRLDEIGSK